MHHTQARCSQRGPSPLPGRTTAARETATLRLLLLPLLLALFRAFTPRPASLPRPALAHYARRPVQTGDGRCLGPLRVAVSKLELGLARAWIAQIGALCHVSAMLEVHMRPLEPHLCLICARWAGEGTLRAAPSPCCAPSRAAVVCPGAQARPHRNSSSSSVARPTRHHHHPPYSLHYRRVHSHRTHRIKTSATPPARRACLAPVTWEFDSLCWRTHGALISRRLLQDSWPQNHIAAIIYFSTSVTSRLSPIWSQGPTLRGWIWLRQLPNRRLHLNDSHRALHLPRLSPARSVPSRATSDAGSRGASPL